MLNLSDFLPTKPYNVVAGIFARLADGQCSFGVA